MKVRTPLHRYYRYRWNESRGDDYDHWGPATYFLTAEHDGFVVGQVEVYDSGRVLVYDQQHWRDEFGALTDQPITMHDPVEELDAEAYTRLTAGLTRTVF